MTPLYSSGDHSNMAAVGFSFPTIDARSSPIFQISVQTQLTHFPYGLFWDSRLAAKKNFLYSSIQTTAVRFVFLTKETNLMSIFLFQIIISYFFLNYSNFKGLAPLLLNPSLFLNAEMANYSDPQVALEA